MIERGRQELKLEKEIRLAESQLFHYLSTMHAHTYAHGYPHCVKPHTANAEHKWKREKKKGKE